MSKKKSKKSLKQSLKQSPPKPETEEEEYPRLSVSPMTASLVVGCFVALFAPFYVSGFWPASLNLMAGAALAPQSLFLGITSLACLFVGMAGRLENEEKAPKSDVDFLIAVLLAWYAISLLLASYRHDAILETARAGGVICWYFLVREWFKKLAPQKFVAYILFLMGCVTVGTLVVVIPALVNYFQTHNPRQFGTFYNPNMLANFCAMAAPLAAGGALYVLRFKTKTAPANSILGDYAKYVPLAIKVLSALFGIASLVILAGLIVTSSKGGMLALLVAAVVFAIAFFKARKETNTPSSPQRKVLLAGIGVVIVVGVIFMLSQTVWPRLEGALHDDHSSMFRWYAWVATAKMAMARPLFGWGPGSFPSIFPLFAIAGYTRSAHQSWLQLAAENGFPAMIILALALVTGWRAGWKSLKGINAPLAVGALAAIVAFAVHGMVDSGWGIISIGWLLMVTLGILATLEVIPQNTPSDQKPVSLNWPWLAAAVIVGGLSWVTQHAATGEDLRAQSIKELQISPKKALATAHESINVDPANIRLWDNLARIQWSSGKDATKAYEKAIKLLPVRAMSYFNLAGYLQNTAPVKDKKRISKLYDKAIALDHNDTTLRMARAKWEITHHNKKGWDDLRYILQLQQKPYGKYPAVPEIVNFDYGEAALMLARHALDQDKPEKAKPLLQQAQVQIKKGNTYINSKYQQEVLQSVGKNNDEDRQKVADMEAEYEELKKRLKK